MFIRAQICTKSPPVFRKYEAQAGKKESKNNIPVAVLIQDFRVLPDRLSEVQSLSIDVINFGYLIIIETIDSEDIEDVVELLAFVNVFSLTAGFVGPCMFRCSMASLINSLIKEAMDVRSKRVLSVFSMYSAPRPGQVTLYPTFG